MKTTNKLMASFATVLLLSSCSKEKEEGSLSFRLQTTNRSSNTGRVNAGVLAWTSGSAYVESSKIEAKNETNAEVEFKTQVNRRVDLFASASTLGSVRLSPGTYREIEATLTLSSAGSDTALILRGSFTNSSGVSTPVMLAANGSILFETEVQNVTLTGNASFTLVSSLNLSVITSALTEVLLNAATRTNGVIVISATQNTTLYALLTARFNDCDEVELD